MSLNKSPVFKSIFPILIFFLLVSSLAFILGDTLRRLNIDQPMVIAGNLILFVVTVISFGFYRKALYAGNTHAFLRNVYSSLFLKFFVCLIGIFLYVFTAGTSVNKPGLLGLLLLYLIYTFLEIGILMNESKQIKQNKNA
jgi:hypothetical protein